MCLYLLILESKGMPCNGIPYLGSVSGMSNNKSVRMCTLNSDNVYLCVFTDIKKITGCLHRVIGPTDREGKLCKTVHIRKKGTGTDGLYGA